MVTPKETYWLNNVWGELPYRVPGTEGLVLPAGFEIDRPSSPEDGHIRYNKDSNRLEAYVNFQWETVVSGEVSTVATVDTINDLPPSPQSDGSLAVVLDDGDGHELLFVWNNTNTDISVVAKWRLLSTTELFSSAVVYRNQVITDLAIQNVGSAFLTVFNPYVKEINVTIVEAFDAGRTLFIQEGGGATLMDSLLINPQLEGTYQLKIPDSTNSNTDGIQDDYLLASTGQVQAVIGGGSGSAGKAVVFVKVVTLLEENP
jgi:hypothetical protein